MTGIDPGWRVRIVASASAALFVVFAVLVERVAIRNALASEGRGCFGARVETTENGTAIAARIVARNLVLAILTAAVACRC